MSRKLNRIFALFVVTAIFAAMLPMMPRLASAEAPALPAQEHRSAQAVNRDIPVPAIPTQLQQPTIVEREDGTRYVSGELIVRFTPDVGRRVAIQSLAPGRLTATGVQSLDKLGTARGLQAIEPIFHRHTRDQAIAAWLDQPPQPSLGDVYRLAFPAGVDVEQLVADYRSAPDVVYAEPNYIYEFDGTPNDPYFGQQWHLHNTGQYHLADADIDAPEAWDVVTGTETIVIAVIDTGVDRDHPDLDDHVWANPGETPGDSIDNDGNGYVDDTWGWNWVSDLSDPDDYDFNDPRDDNGHGTHVAGIAAAETDNEADPLGVAGVCWNCRIMSLKAFESNGMGTTSDIVQAINYAADKGADVINMSFGSYAESLLLEDTLADAYGQAVLVAAAGNYGKTALATTPYYPSSYSYVLGVGATDVGCVNPPSCSMTDEFRAGFSNYGINADVGAPGVSIYSTFRGGGYASLSGTSMATPIVSGLAALLLSQNPTWSKEMARGQIIKTAEGIYTGEFGRVNAYSALTVVPTPDVTMLDDSILYGDSTGDGDGIPDAGETFTITMLLKNYWGEALTTTAVLSTTDPYVTIISNTAAFGDISAYATMRNTATPFQAVLTTTAPNNHQVSFDLDITANGGAYNTTSGFSFLVQRGIEIPDPLFPAVITESMTLHSDYLYIVKQNMLVPEGVTLTIKAGTRLQFDPAKFIRVEGALIADGTEELPIIFTSNQSEPSHGDFAGIIFDDPSIDATLAPTATFTVVAADGEPLADFGTVISLTIPPLLTRYGDLYFAAEISGTPDFQGLFHYIPDIGFDLLVRTGDDAPGGGQFAGFDEFAVTDSGNIYFIADISGGSAASGVFQIHGGELDDIALEGEVIPNGTVETFTGFEHLMAMENQYQTLTAFAAQDNGATGVGVYVQRMELDHLLAIPLPDLQQVRGLDALQYLGGPDINALYDGNDQIRSTVYENGSETYSSGVIWGDDATFDVGQNDHRFQKTVGGFTISLVGLTGELGRALLNCASPCTVNEDSILLQHGDPLPGGGVIDLSGAVEIGEDHQGLLVSVVVSGTGTTRLVRLLDDGTLENVLTAGMLLPDGSSVDSLTGVAGDRFSNRFGEWTAIVGTAAGQRLLFAEPNLDYVSGSILDHVVVEYGGGLYLNSSSPYLSNLTIRYSGGTIRMNGDFEHLILRDSEILDNPSRGVDLMIDSGLITLLDNLISNNREYYDWAGMYIRPQTSVAVDVRGNRIEYNQSSNCAGAGASLYHGGDVRFVSNDFRKNSVYSTWRKGGGGGLCFSDGIVAVRGNTFANNIDHFGSTTGSSGGGLGGSALNVADDGTILASYNTFVGNEARPGTGNWGPEPGFTIKHQGAGSYNHNNILNNQSTYDLCMNGDQDVEATLNYWGSTDPLDIRYNHIWDYYQIYAGGEVFFQPFLTAPEPLAPGFLWNATTYPPDPIGAETMTITLDFSRDMNTTITPTVTFGVAEPYTQQSIESGGWISPTRWVGAYDVTVDTGDGINTLKISNAEDTDGMPIPEDTRFSFVIQTAGTASILLEATASVGQVDLTWTQNDVTDLAGYILYRSPYTNTDYAQIGDGMFIATTYTDTAVTNGILYYYQYSVLDTDFNEVAWSNEVSVTPDDYTLPATPSVTDDGTSTYYFDRLHATWASQDPETGVAEYQYCIGTASDNCDTISWTSMGTLTETTKSGLNLTDGQTYYFNVKARNGADHWSTTGSSDGITVDKLPPPVITAVEPITGVRNTSHVITFTGSGFQASPAPVVRLGLGDHEGSPLQSVNVVNPTQLTALVPQGIAAGVYTATVTNFDTQIGALANGYTATNPTVGPRPFLFSPSTQRVGDDETSTTVDVQIQDVSDLAAFQFDVTYNPAMVHVSDVTLGWFLGNGGRNTADLGPDIDNTAGRVTFGGFSYGTGSGAEGNGTLATITFSPQATGTTTLTFENVQLRDTLNSEIPADLQSGEIEVVHYPFGDLDRDCDVDVADIMVVASRWNDPANYDPAYDFDSDGDIDVADIMQVAAAWGNTCNGTGMTAMALTSCPIQDGADVSFAPPAMMVQVGVSFTMSLAIEQVTDLGGFEFDLLFNPDVITVTGVHLGGFLGGFLGSSGNNVVALGPRAEEDGRLVFGGFSYGEHEGVSGYGSLATLELTLLDDTETVLRLEDVQLVTSGAAPLPQPSVGEGRVQTRVRIYLPLVLR